MIRKECLSVQVRFSVLRNICSKSDGNTSICNKIIKRNGVYAILTNF